MSLDRDMLQRWIARQRRSLSLREIYSAWEPTWGIEELEAMLRDMRKQGRLLMEDNRIIRYRTACSLETESQA